MKATLLNKLIVTAALAAAGSLYAADAPAGKPADKPVTKAQSPAVGDVKKDVEKFGAQRDTMLAERQALINQLKTASEEHRKAILEKMKALGDAQRELSKQLRDDLRKQRQR
jgi:hypothetical protein